MFIIVNLVDLPQAVKKLQEEIKNNKIKGYR